MWFAKPLTKLVAGSYSLMVIGVAMKASSFEDVCWVIWVDKNGQKMSKTKGNAVDPWETSNKQCADTVRWYMAKCPTGNQLMFQEADLEDHPAGFP